MAEGKTEKLIAQIVVEGDCVILYYVGDPVPERISRHNIERVTVSLRDPEGPCVWIEDRVAPIVDPTQPAPSVEPGS
jgi:hypothetical protein